MKHLVLLFLLSFVVPLLGQTVDPLVYTVGKVFPGDTHHHAYVLWQPGDPSATFGKQFAIYRKDGDSNSGNPYVLLGRTKLQTGPGAIHALLKLGDRFDHNSERVGERINTLYAESLNEPGSEPAPPEIPTIEEAKKLAHLLKLAATDIKILERLFFLGRTHPGVYLSLGHAFSVKTTPTAVQTYEIREVDGAGTDFRVVGRVTLDSASPEILNRTSRPFEVFFQAKQEHQEVASPRNHLVTRQRWGIPNDLRRQFPHTFGFNLYRVKENVAVEFGWHLPGAFPNTAVLEDLIEASLNEEDPILKLDPPAKRVNTLPLMATALMTAVEAADTGADPETFFAHDDNDPPTNPFEDGEVFYYFVAARDIAGYPGEISEGTRVILCDRLPPTAPSVESVTNVYKTASAAALSQLKGNQHLRIRIRQTPELPEKNAAKRYYIYRWSEHTQHLSLGGNPVTNLVGVVNHLPGERFVDFDDDGVGAPKITPTDESEFGQTWWYTIRAEDDSDCAPKNLSAHSPPGFGVLRDRAGPLKPTGFVTRCRYIPRIICEEEVRLGSREELGLPRDFKGFVARFERKDSMVASFDFEVIDQDPNPDVILVKSSRFYQLTSTIDVPISVDLLAKPSLALRVRMRLTNGVVSNWVVCQLERVQFSEELIPVVLTEFYSLERCSPVTRPPGSTPVPHDVVGPGGAIIGPTLTGVLPLETHEYRFYRRVGDEGAFEMISRGSGAAIPAILPANISTLDPAPPTECDTEVCYFFQVFDENGNSSARVKIGCVTMKNGDLGVPMVSDPTSLVESGGKAQLKLEWFCDPVGVERFEIWCASSTQADPGLESLLIGPKLDTLDGAIIASDASALTFCGYQTATVASDKLGSGAEFSATLSVPAGQELTFAVRAVGKGSYQNPPVDDLARPVGPFSNTVSAIWSVPDPDPQDVIPWPALGIPGASDQSLEVANYQPGEGPFFALPLPEPDTHSSAILMGAYSAIEAENLIPDDRNPLSIFFTFREQNVHPIPLDGRKTIYPFVIYRHQVSSSAYPNAVPNLVQVSPLIDRISYGNQTNGSRVLRDPFFRFVPIQKSATGGPTSNFEIPVGGTFSRTLGGTILDDPARHPNVPYYRDFNSLMYWVDPMPIAKGASYQYLIVHFTDRGEIDRVIPTNIVNH